MKIDFNINSQYSLRRYSLRRVSQQWVKRVTEKQEKALKSCVHKGFVKLQEGLTKIIRE